ncbi:hypothetical protein D3C76_332630 [compost metagenome]
MKAVTIIQPFATLVALEEKKLETRSWSTKHRGPLAVHAGKKIDRKICQQEPYRSILLKHGYKVDNLPTGAVLAIGRLVDCHQVIVEQGNTAILGNHAVVSGYEYLFGDYNPGRYAWELSDMARLQQPIEIKGMQGLWNFNYDMSTIAEWLE